MSWYNNFTFSVDVHIALSIDVRRIRIYVYSFRLLWRTKKGTHTLQKRDFCCSFAYCAHSPWPLSAEFMQWTWCKPKLLHRFRSVCLFIYLFLISLLFVGSLRALSIWFASCVYMFLFFFFFFFSHSLLRDFMIICLLIRGEILRFHAIDRRRQQRRRRRESRPRITAVCTLSICDGIQCRVQ